MVQNSTYTEQRQHWGNLVLRWYLGVENGRFLGLL